MGFIAKSPEQAKFMRGRLGDGMIPFSLSQFMLSQADGFWFDFRKTDRLFQEPEGTTPANDAGELIGLALDQRTWNGKSLEQILDPPGSSPTTAPGNHAVQATAGFKPKYQLPGVARFDSLDDYLAPDYTFQNGANFIVAKITMPVSLAATQVILGANLATDGNRLRLGVANTGLLRVSVAGLDLDGITDLRNKTTIVGLSVNNGDIKLFVNDSTEVTSAFSGFTITSTTPVFLGARNNAGAAANSFGGDIHAIVAGRQTISLNDFKRIAASL